MADEREMPVGIPIPTWRWFGIFGENGKLEAVAELRAMLPRLQGTVRRVEIRLPAEPWFCGECGKELGMEDGIARRIDESLEMIVCYSCAVCPPANKEDFNAR